MQVFTEIIACVNSYEEWHRILKEKTKKEKGDLQEILIKYYFLSHSKMYSVDRYIARVCDTIPDGIPVKDWGTDGYIYHKNGKISLVQVKFRSDKSATMHRHYVGNVALEAGHHLDKKKFQHIYLVTDTDSGPTNLSKEEIDTWSIKFLTSDILWEMDWELVKGYILSEGQERVMYTLPPLRSWQSDALEFFDIDNERLQIVAPCGSGKTRVMLEMSRHHKRVVIIVPTLHLLSQTFATFAKYLPDRTYVLVGSDVDRESEEYANVPYDMTTDPTEIKRLVDDKDDYIIISTYQSLDKVHGVDFDLTMADEAHRICGASQSNYNIPVRQNFPGGKRVFLTATPRIYTGSGKNEEVISMDDEDVFGPRYTYSFRNAIEDNVISDYDITTGHAIIDEKSVFDENRFNALFLYKSIQRNGYNSVLIFNNSHEKSYGMYAHALEIFKEKGLDEYELILMPKCANSKVKNNAVRKVQTGRKVIVFNVRVFILGSDLPKLESVMICGARFSKIDIVQSVSRCLRKCHGKDIGHILIPCLVRGENYDDDGNYESQRRLLIAMGSIDEAIVEEILLRRKGGKGVMRRIFTLDMGEMIEDIVDVLHDDDFVVKTFKRVSLSSQVFGVSNWRENLALCIDWTERHGKAPRAGGKDCDKEEKTSGQWLSHQRSNLKTRTGIMANPDIRKEWEAACERCPQLKSVDNVEEWRKSRRGVEEYIDRHGKKPRINGKDLDEEEKTLGHWLSTQRANLKMRTHIMASPDIRKEWEEACERYPQLKSIDNVEKWRKSLRGVEGYIEMHGKAPRFNGKDRDEEEKTLGTWLSDQRKNLKTRTKIMTNPDIRKEWEDACARYAKLSDNNVDKWMKSRRGVEAYIDTHGKAPRCKGKDRDEEETTLGTWLSTTRSNLKTRTKIMTNPDIRKEWEEVCNKYPQLQSVDNVEVWRDSLNGTIEFIERHGKAPRCKGNDRDEEEKTYGKWLSHTRSNYKICKYIMTNPDVRKEWEDACERCPQLKSVDNMEEWRDSRRGVEAYIERRGKIPNKRSLDEDEKTQGLWLSNTRGNYKTRTGIMTNPDVRKEWEEACKKYPLLGTISKELPIQSVDVNTVDLDGLNLGKLKDIAKELKIPCYSRYRSDNKQELIDLIINTRENPSVICMESISPEKDELSSMTLTKLKDIARDIKIPGYSKYKSSNKGDLENLIRNVRKDSPELNPSPLVLPSPPVLPSPSPPVLPSPSPSKEGFGRSTLENIVNETNGYYIKEVINSPSPPSQDLSKLTVNELRVLAKEKNLKGYSRLKKVELIKLIESNQIV
jgi:superfamily II DNA or RNA helicase